MKKGQDYTDLSNGLKKMGALKVCFSEWLLASPKTSEAVFDAVRQLIDDNDRLIVVGVVSGSPTWTGGVLMATDDQIQAIFAKG
jgi:hypothetical protein